MKFVSAVHVNRAGLVIGGIPGIFPVGRRTEGADRIFFFCQGPSRRDNEQPVAHWFVSCIDSVNHPITMRYRRSDEVLLRLYKDRFTPTSSASAFPTFSQQLYQEQACSVVCDAGQRARQEEESS